MKRHVWTAVLSVAVTAVYILRLDRSAGLVVDDGWYVLLAKALAQGDGYRLISSAAVEIMPVVPPGFPLLLSPVFLVSPQFPDNVFLLKAVSIAAMLGVGAVLYRYLTTYRATPALPAAGIAVATVLTPAFVFLATSTVMAECVFTLAQVAAVVLIERSARARTPAGQFRAAALAGLAAGGAVLTRTAGVALLLAAGLYLMKERAWRRAVAFAGAALVCIGPWLAYSAAHAPTALESAEHGGPIAYAYSELFSMRRPGDPAAGRMAVGDLPAQLVRNAVDMLGRSVSGVIVPAFLRGPDESGEEVVALGGTTGILGASMGSARVTMAVSLGISGFALIGLVTNLRRRVTVAELLTLASIGMIALVPGRTFRYILPLAPFLWMYFVAGLQTVGDAVGQRLRLVALDGWSVVRVTLLCLIALQVLEHAQYVRLVWRGDPAPDWLADAREVDDLLEWMHQNLPDDDAVATTNPGLVYLRTGRRTLASDTPAQNWRRWQARGVRYLVSLRPVATPSLVLGFTKLYESRRRRLWVIEMWRPPPLPSVRLRERP